jgi:hypothetical protein
MKTNYFKKEFMIMVLMILSISIQAQEAKKLYDPTLDGMKQLNEAIVQAKSAGKHVLVQYGGN